MPKKQYGVFIRWFFAVFAGYYIISAIINLTVDPFFKYNDEKKSLSTFKVSKSFNEMLTKISLLKYQNSRKYIFGDSRGNSFSNDILESLEPGGWYNFSIGHAFPVEITSLVEYTLKAVRKNQIDHVIIVLPIRLFVDRRTDRFTEANELLASNFFYLTNTLVLKASIANLVYLVRGTILKSQKQEGTKEAAWKFWLNHARLKTLDWQAPYNNMERFTSLFDLLRKNDISFTILLPPIHKDLQKVYIEGMPEIWQKYISFYSQFPETRNCLLSENNSNAALFRDPFHSDSPYSELVIHDVVSNKQEICFSPSARKVRKN